MKKKPIFITIFFATQIFLVFFYINRQAKIIKLSYYKQKLENQKETLLAQKEKSSQLLSQEKNRLNIKTFVKQELGFDNTKLEQIKSFKNGTQL